MNKDVEGYVEQNLSKEENQKDASNLGQLFRQARQARHLSLEDVHQKIQLRPIILEQLEANQFYMPHSTPSFVKGYIRCYAKFLGIPEQAYESVIQGLVDKTAITTQESKHTDLNDELHRSHWANFAIILVVFTLLAVTVLWWWENYRQQSITRDELVSQHQSLSNLNGEKSEHLIPADLTSDPLSLELPKAE